MLISGARRAADPARSGTGPRRERDCADATDVQIVCVMARDILITLIIAGAAGLLTPVAPHARLGAYGVLIRRVALATIVATLIGAAVIAVMAPQSLLRGL